MSKLMGAARRLVLPAVVAVVYFTSAGRWDMPIVWGLLGEMAAFIAAASLLTDPAMMAERRRPGPGERDRLTRPIGIALLVGHWVLAGLDVGRFQWSVVPVGVRIGGLVGYAASLALVVWAMRVNPFYSSAVRIQKERGHRPVTTGPYRCVRHPGYAATVLAAVTGGLTLGSWLGMAPIAAFLVLLLRRVAIEERMLRRELDGYEAYARRVRYRLVPGLF